MNLNDKGINIIKKYEAPKGPDLVAYLCPVGKWTIGFGNTFYKDGSSVKKGDKITKEGAEDLIDYVLDKFIKEVKSLVKKPLSDNQFSALVSFAYNIGSDIDDDTIAEGLGDSTLLKKVNINPSDPTIRQEFMKWNKGTINGVKKELPGLTKRRVEEANLYFS